jgi:putative endonuclease
MSRGYFVYILTNTKRGVLYVGLTNNVARRLEQHSAKAVDAFTRRYGIVRLVHLEQYASIDDARARERTLKRWRRDWKIKLIEERNRNWDDLSSQL